MWPIRLTRTRPAGATPGLPAPGHPERLIPDVPATDSEAALWRQMQRPDPAPLWMRLLVELRWIAGMGTFMYIPEPPYWGAPDRDG